MESAPDPCGERDTGTPASLDKVCLIHVAHTGPTFLTSIRTGRGPRDVFAIDSAESMTHTGQIRARYTCDAVLHKLSLPLLLRAQTRYHLTNRPRKMVKKSDVLPHGIARGAYLGRQLLGTMPNSMARQVRDKVSSSVPKIGKSSTNRSSCCIDFDPYPGRPIYPDPRPHMAAALYAIVRTFVLYLTLGRIDGGYDLKFLLPSRRNKQPPSLEGEKIIDAEPEDMYNDESFWAGLGKKNVLQSVSPNRQHKR